MGRGQVVKAAGFDPATAGSTPAAPATKDRIVTSSCF